MSQSSTPAYRSVFDQVHDVVVFGAGYAGFFAARALVAQGKKVLLVDRRAAVLAESGWSFEAVGGDNDTKEWQSWLGEMKACHGALGRKLDGAIAEVVANEWLWSARREGKLNVLYYATPVAVECNGFLEAVIVGTKAGLQRLVARQWIDTTDTGELLGLLTANWQAPQPSHLNINLFFRRADWPNIPDTEGEFPDLMPGAEVRWTQSLWPNERWLHVTLPDGSGPARLAWIPMLRCLHQRIAAGLMPEAVLTHGSVEAYAHFEEAAAPEIPRNVMAANPWCGPSQWLGQRVQLGLDCAQAIRDAPQAKVGESMLHTAAKTEIPWREMETEVAVAGAGTGGALAALAAARQGVPTLAFDPLPFCGGIGAGGGIHWYYFGVKGGLQEELDERLRTVMPLFGQSGQIQGFHPDAKKCVLEEMLRESGVELLYGATLLDVELDGNRVQSALLSTPNGPVRLKAKSWIDSTGDGDLAARAGAGVRFGRDGDGLIHAYSQSSGRAGIQNDKARMQVVNYDAGFVDPTDSEDLTRARLEGIHHYIQAEYAETDRPTYIAPAIGLRQSRHIETDYVLELADLIERREFTDSVGLTGCHYDNHAVDYEFESDEGMFWVWVCRQWRGRIACEIPYRILLPQGLDNVWLACRALGVSQDAHHSLRMQRDMQRIGEVAGVAGALAAREGAENRKVPFTSLRDALEKSGALESNARADDTFGPDTKGDSVVEHHDDDIAMWLEAIQNAPAAESFEAPWHLYRAGQNSPPVRERVLALLDSQNDLTSWRAAAIAAMWDESAAEPRLLRSIAERDAVVKNEDGDDHKSYRCDVPQWLIAVSLLRRVGSPSTLAALNDLASEPELLHNARTAIALCCEGIAARHALDETQRTQILEILWKLIESPAPNSVVPPQRPLMQTEFGTPKVLEDFTWQIHLAVARARRALGLPPHEQAVGYLTDERALVRRAFTAVCADIATAV